MKERKARNKRLGGGEKVGKPVRLGITKAPKKKSVEKLVSFFGAFTEKCLIFIIKEGRNEVQLV